MNTPSTIFRGPEPVEDRGVFTDAETYYSNKTRHNHGLRRTYSQNGLMKQFERLGLKAPYRRGSHDVATVPGERRFLIHVDATLRQLQSQEDTDDNCQITIEDNGPKVLTLRTADSAGHNAGDVRGTYALSNLLQELTLAKDYGRTEIILDEARLVENPVSRLSRLIRDHFWAGLTRRLDESSVEVASRDDKDWTDNPRPRIYVPKSLPEQLEYYRRVAQKRPELGLDVCELPAEITGEYVRDLNTKPGVLALAMEKVRDPATGGERLRGVPFVVPGGRFNEMYGWDSYFETLGLLVNDKVELAKGMVTNFCFCIQHYGKILNATRSYYLGRSQPPFITDMALRVYDKIRHEAGAKDFLRHAMLAAVKEYHTVWMASPRYDPKTGLSRYGSVGVGVPPEVERGHFDVVLRPFADKHGMTVDEFTDAYTYGRVAEPDLDVYFAHDRAVRESGHDTTYRLDGGCADIATIDLNSLLFKLEVDIARTIPNLLGGQLIMTAGFATGTPYAPGDKIVAARFDRAAKRRKMAMDKYLWDEEKGMFFDYNTVKGEPLAYETATTFWTLWAGAASAGQAAAMVVKALPRLEAYSGLVSTTLDSRGKLGPDRPARQWDFPYGWAPQQMLAWTGLLRYGHEEEAERLAYKWLFMMTKAFVDFNGVVAEKYDVTRPIDPHRVDVEYGNVGLGFRGVVREGFGWVNASYVYGLQIVNGRMRLALGAMTPYETYIKAVDAWKEKELAEMS